ncbi:hypothetical protein F4825DRAFT_307838 [Nemania diffusa]|nr:hypothetical protein F4825DRAFT_307838 [Nemania diffusa]
MQCDLRGSIPPWNKPRPVIARAQVRTAHKYNCKEARTCLGRHATLCIQLLPQASAARNLTKTNSLSVIAPWRMPAFFNRF